MAARPKHPVPPPRRVRLLVSTRKGLWTLTGDARGAAGSSPARSSSVISCITRWSIRATARRCSPPRAPATSGPPIFRSADSGRPGRRRPRRPRSPPTAAASSITRSGSRRGTHRSPASGMRGRRRRACSARDDGGVTWEGVAGFNAHPQRKAWCGGDQDGTPDGPKLHSILVDPRDPDAYVYQHVERRHVRVARRAAPTGIRSTRACAPSSFPIPIPSSGRTRIACALPAAIPIASTSRTTAASIASIVPATRWERHRR